MDLMTAAIIGSILGALIIAVFMVAYRYNKMGNELKTSNANLKKLIKLHTDLMAQIADLSTAKTDAPAPASTHAQPPPPPSREISDLRVVLDDIVRRIEALDHLVAERLAVSPPGAPMPTIPFQRKPPEPKPAPPLEKTRPIPMADRIQPPKAPPPLEEPHTDAPDKGLTSVRCPSCSRLLPYDALKIQDEQTCPFCETVFRSSDYLLSLIGEGAKKIRPTEES